MVASTGPLATIDGKLRQARKGATVAIDSCAGVWLVGVHHQFPSFLKFRFPSFLKSRFSSFLKSRFSSFLKLISCFVPLISLVATFPMAFYLK